MSKFDGVWCVTDRTNVSYQHPLVEKNPFVDLTIGPDERMDGLISSG